MASACSTGRPHRQADGARPEPVRHHGAAVRGRGRGEALLAGTRTLTRGHLRIAADSATPCHGGARRASAIGHPGPDLLAHDRQLVRCARAVMDYEADVAVTAKQTSDPRILQRSAARPTGWSASCAPTIPSRSARLDRRSRRSTSQDLVLRERGSVTREVFEARLAEAGIRPGRLLEVQTARGGARGGGGGLRASASIFGSEFRRARGCSGSRSRAPTSRSPNTPSASRSAGASRWCAAFWRRSQESASGSYPSRSARGAQRSCTRQRPRAAIAAAPSGSRRRSAPRTARSISRSAATSGIGATVMAQIAIQ